MTTCHLGGGRAEGDGLAMFKRSFGGRAVEFHSGSRVIHHDVYRRLTEARAEQLGISLAALEDAAFFPAFRSGAG
jgi:hypothetical protein